MDYSNLNLPADRRKQLEKLLDQAHEDYRSNLDNLRKWASDDLETLAGSNPESIKELIKEYTDSASQLANDYYDLQRQAWQEYADVTMPDFDHTQLIDSDRVLWQQQGGFANTDFNGLTYKQVKEGQSRAGMSVDDLWPNLSDPATAQRLLDGMITTATRLTTQRNTRLDPTKPRWARVPHGSKTCAFCAMLASRGFAYTSESSAEIAHTTKRNGLIYHDDCRCSIEPSWGKRALAGYDPDAYYRMYQEGIKAAGDAPNQRNILKAMRRLHPTDLTDGVTPKPNIRWSHKPIAPTTEELNRLADFTMQKPNDKYTSEQKTTALRAWTGNAYERINGALFDNATMTKDLQEQIDIIDEALADHSTQRQFTVDRLMRISTFGVNGIESLSDAVGKRITHKGFMATSLDVGGKEVGDGKRLATRILLPPGTSAAYLEEITHIKGEEEILVSRGAKLLVEDVGYEDGSPVAYLRLLQ